MENLKSFLDNELDLATKTEVEAQLRNDTELSQMASDFRTISASLKTADAGAPYGLDQLEAKLAKPSQPVSNKKVWRLAWGSSALGLLVTLVMLPNFFSAKEAAKRTLGDETVMPASAGAAEMSDQVAASAPESMNKATATAPPNFEAASPVETSQAGDESKTRGGVFRDGYSDPTLSKAKTYIMPNEPSVTGSLYEPKGIYLEKNGEVSVKVENLQRVIDEVNGIASSFKGFVVNSNMLNQQDSGSANVTLRIPTANFASAMNRIQSMGEVVSVSSTSQDITNETIDNSSRMETWALEEQRLIDELKKAKKSSDRLAIRQQLIQVRANLDAYRSMVKSLKDRANYSTINATFVRGDTEMNGMNKSWGENSLRDAKEALSSTGKFFGALGIYMLVFSPIWLPIAIAAFVIRKRRA